MTARRTVYLFLLAFPALSDAHAAADPTRQWRVAGIYTLQRVNEQPLPFTIDAARDRMTVLLGGSVVLRGDGTYATRLSLRATLSAGGTTQEYPVVSRGTYVLRRDRLHIADEDYRKGFLGFMEEEVERVTLCDRVLTVSVRPYRPRPRPRA